MNPLRKRPLGTIALSLSGGGYRAAAFHLGTLDALHRLRLLRDVRILSSVSGGTLVACRYALAAARREPFDAFFASFYRFMARTNVIDEAVARLAAGHRPRTLIAAAADVYADDALLGDARLGDLMTARSHVREVILNATELRTGHAFRFQAGRRPARIGNRNVSIRRADARRLRLADIAAASSCFPGAFEPLAFPEDFAVPGAPIEMQGRAAGPRLPLMDGGIYDNQGVQALLLASRRARARGRGPDTFLVSDTSQQPPELFRLDPPAQPGRLTVQGALWLLRGLAAACLASTALLAWRIAAHPPDAVVLGLPLVLTTTVGIGLPLLRRRLRAAIDARYPGDADLLWRWVHALPLGETLALAELRLRSLVALNDEVYMKRIRSLGYERLYGRSEFEGRRVANLVHDLVTARPRADGLTPSPGLVAVARRAVAMPTTLWFDDEATLRAVVACGQATLCANVLEHLLARAGGDPAMLSAPERALEGAARELWERLASEPEILLRDRAPVS